MKHPLKHPPLVMMVLAAALVGCASERGSVATEPALAPSDPALAKALLGLPPPPRVVGRLIANFSIPNLSGKSTAVALTFVVPAAYNRDTTLTRHQLELTTQSAGVRANATGVQRAYGSFTAVSQDASATLTLDLSQLSGFSGPLFAACTPPTSVNCALLDANVTGSILHNGNTVTAIGNLKVRWETN